MANIKVRIQDAFTLVLEQDAKVGDTIDLKEVQSVDLKYINEAITSASLKEYRHQIEDEFKTKEKILQSESLSKINELQQKLESFEEQKKKELENMNLRFNQEKEKEISYLKSLENSKYQELKESKIIEINELELSKAKEINDLKERLEKQRQDEISKLKTSIQELENKINNANVEKEHALTSLKNSISLEQMKTENELNNKIKDLENQIASKNQEITTKLLSKDIEANKLINDIKENYTKEVETLESKLSQLTLQKSSLNIKMLGEELEKWCNEEFESYANAGFYNTTWEKDNSSIKEEDEIKGTKADYIFRVFLDRDHNLELSSVCCEMKNESITSVNKKKNSDHFAKLDKDRIKKNCEYALLISELEWDSANDSPIKKVREYDKMYIVRPQYFITFLSLISSMADKYKDIITEKQQEALNLKTSLEIKEEFDALKTSYLEKPLETLNKKIEDIKAASDSITKANQKIQETCSEIVIKTIESMKTKINNFGIQKITKKIDKLL